MTFHFDPENCNLSTAVFQALHEVITKPFTADLKSIGQALIDRIEELYGVLQEED